MGIDYGRGMTNIDHENGIRYGVISMHDVCQAWCDCSEPEYPCDECIGNDDTETMRMCDICEPSLWFYNEEGYMAESCFDGCEIMIYKSPFYSYGAFCSPCVPGAINLTDTRILGEGDVKAYCFGHDWFEGGKAPYRVFRVSDGKEVFLWTYLLRYRYTNKVKEFTCTVYADTIGEASKEVEKCVPKDMMKGFVSSSLQEHK